MKYSFRRCISRESRLFVSDSAIPTVMGSLFSWFSGARKRTFFYPSPIPECNPNGLYSKKLKFLINKGVSV